MSEVEIRNLRRKMRLIQRNLGWQWKNDAECCGITVAQCHVLTEIGDRGEISVVELAAILGLDTSTLSRTVDGMVRSGLARRHVNPDDRRYVVISLTAQGRTVYENIDSTFNRYFADTLELIPVEKRGQVLESLSLLADAVQQAGSRCCREG